MTRGARVLAIGFALACVWIALSLGYGYIPRLPNHAGYFMVSVPDEARAPEGWRPRHTVFILVDGLRRDAAERMKVTRQLERFGQCRISDQGTYTVSRPEYALLSTGLEVDRSGARNNDLTTPLAAESVWQVARESGLRVAGTAHLPWFKQLFPDGFDRHEQREETSSVFATGGELLDVNVFLPLYVDHTAHFHGAASADYEAAVERADREIGEFLTRVDLEQDLVVLTADHGHRDAGGHGGSQPEVRNVLACFAGKNVRRAAGRAPFDGLNTAPLLSVLLGTRFPKNMRAGEDRLDELWSVVRAGESPAETAYLEGRRASVERFRARNEQALEEWLGGQPARWSRLYEREARAQNLRSVAFVGVTLIGLAVAVYLRKLKVRKIAVVAGLLAYTLVVVWAVHRMVLGEFDYSVVNREPVFLARGFTVGGISAVLSLLAHRFATRTRQERLIEWLSLVVLLLALNLAHIGVYGWPLGFPLPPASLRYLPLFGGFVLASYAAVAAVLVVLDWVRAPSSK